MIGQNYWESISFPDSLNTEAINAEMENILFVATGGNNEFQGLFRSRDGSVTWKLLEVDSVISYVDIFCIRYDNNGILYLGTSAGIYKSIDNGNNFVRIYNHFSNILGIRFSVSGDIFARGWNKIIRSSNNGVTWDTILYVDGNMYFSDLDFGQNEEIYTLGCSFDGQNTGSGFYRSLDNGETWEITGLEEFHHHSVRVNNENEIIVDGTYFSDDGGTSWSNISNIYAHVMERYGDDLLLAGRYINLSSGCWFSEDWGNTWIDMVDSVLINSHVHQISVSPSNTIYLQCSYGSGSNQLYKSINPILELDFKYFTSGVVLFPNPANEKIWISNNTTYRINSFSVFDSNGQKIRTEENRNNEINVSNLNSGLYIIELNFENNSVMRKVIIE